MRKGDRRNLVSMIQRLFLYTGLRVPQDDRGIVAAARQKLAVRREGKGNNEVVLAFECLLESSRLCVPDANIAAHVCAGHHLAVAGKDHRIDRVGMSCETPPGFACLNVPQLYRLLIRTGERPAIG